jgi:hypothetical protein
MIKLTYEHICDGCKAHLATEVYHCTNVPNVEFPKPHRRFSFDWTGLNAQLCKDCAQPMYEAVEQMKEAIRARGENT